MIESNTVARRALASFTQSLGITLSPDIEVANWDLMLKFARSGMGIGCVPREYALKEIQSGEKQISLRELSNTEDISDQAFQLIVQAVTVMRLGVKALQLKEESYD